MKICPNCGWYVADDTVLCEKCGTPIPAQNGAQTPQSPPPQSPIQPPPAQPAPPAPPKSGGFCPNCGAPQTGSAFCSNCGVPLTKASQAQVQAQPQTQTQPQVQAPAQTPPAKTGGGAARKVILGVVAVVLVGALGFGGFKLVSFLLGGGSRVGLLTSEEAQFVGYQQEALSNRMLSGLSATMDRLGSGRLSTDLTITASVRGNSEIQKVLDGSAVTLSLEMDKGSFLANAGLVLMGSPVLSGMVTYDQGTAGFYLPELDKNYYTADLSRLVKNLSGRRVDLSALSLPTVSGQEWSSLLQGYLDVVFGMVNPDNLEVEKNLSFHLPQLNESYKGTVYTFTPQAKDIERMILDLASRLDTDKDLRRMLLEIINADGLIDAFGYDAFDGADPEDEINNMIAEIVDTLEENAGDIADELEDINLTWTLYMEGREVRMITFSAENQYGDEAVIGYERTGSESSGVTELFYAMEEYDGGSEENYTFWVEHSYSKKGSAYTGQVELTNYPRTEWEHTTRLEYEFDSAKSSPLGIPYGSYELTYSIYDYWNGGYQNVSVFLDVFQSSNGGVDHTITVRNLDTVNSAFYSIYGITSVEVTINAIEGCTAKPPSGKEVDISGYSLGELDDLFDSLSDEAQHLLGGTLYDLQRALGMSGDSAAP